MNASPIIVLDSGLGGLTVARAIRTRLPAEDILYFGDTARLPYGSKSAGTVTLFVKQIISYLQSYHPKHVVIACNTATALALPAIRAEFPGMSISGVIEPGAKAAVLAAGSKHHPVIGIMATEATVRSKAYDRAIHRRRNHAHLLLQAAPLLVPIIEDGRKADDPLVKLALKQYLLPMVARELDVLVLGCTHYPILRDAIIKIVGPDVPVIDSAEQCAEDVAKRLGDKGLLKHRPDESVDSQGYLKCFATDDSQRFAKLASRFLGMRIDDPIWVSTDDLILPASTLPLRVPA